jgi:Flp pilus assembly protein TadG
MSVQRRAARTRRTRGQSLVEFALIAPVLIVLIVGAAQVAAILYAGITVASTAHDAAKVASEQPIRSLAFGYGGAAGAATTCTTGSSNPVCQAADQSKGLLGSVTTTIAKSTQDTTPACPTNSAAALGAVPDGYVTVTVSNDVPIFVPFLNNLLANSPGAAVRTISTTVVMRVEPCSITNGK